MAHTISLKVSCSKHGSSSTDSEERIDQSRDAILGRVDLILGQALSASTWSSYKSAVAKYRDYMNWNKLDESNPSVLVMCKWIAFLSLFIEPISICRYLSAVRYFLAERGGAQAANDVVVTRMVRGICKRHGLPVL